MAEVAMREWQSTWAISTIDPPEASTPVAVVWRLCGIPHKRHSVNGRVMWPARVFLLVGASRELVAAT